MKNNEIVQYANMAWQALYVGLDMYGIEYGKDYTNIKVNNSVMIMSYGLKMVNTSKWRKLQGLVPELSQMMQLDGDNKVRVSYNGLEYRIEVPKPRSLHDSVTVQDVARASKGLNIGIGLSAYNNKPSKISFEGDNSGHILISGSTRCGKTNILKIIAMLLMVNNSPDKTRIVVIDTVKSEGKYKELENSAHLAVPIVDTTEKATRLLTWVKNTIIKLKGRKFTHKMIIIIDEVYLLLEDKGIAELLRYIATAGAESGFHLIPATQYTKADDIGGRQFKGNLMTRVAGRVDDHYSSKNATGRDGVGAENLMAPGDFLVVDNYGVNRIAVPKVESNMFDLVPRGMTPIVDLGKIESNTNTPTTKPGNIEACFESIDHRLLHLAIYGRHKDGREFGADVIRKASYVLAKNGMGQSIGQGTANEYVKFAKKIRGIK